MTSSLLFREPRGQYKSFYKYYIEKLQKPLSPTESQPAAGGWTKGHEAWGDGYEEWAKRIPDLQLRELLGNRCTPKLREPVFDVEVVNEGERRIARRVGDKRLPEECKVTTADRERLRRMVEEINVVGTTDRFNLFWLQLADVVGFQHLEYVPSNTRGGGGGGRGKKPQAAAAPGAGAGGDDAAMKEARRNDEWAYGVIRAAQEERTACPTAAAAATGSAGDGCDLQQRVKDYESLSFEDSGRTRTGGAVPRSKYMLVEATEGKQGAAPQNAWLEPDFYTGKPVCKGFGTSFAALVRRDDPTYICDRGCSFD